MGDSKVPPIGPRIRAERERRNVTIRALARVIGVSPSLISQIETGKSQPSVSSLYSIPRARIVAGDLFDARYHRTGSAAAPASGFVFFLSTDRAKAVGA
jgi:transcriptional regulator with XRE-family HTH domain